MRCKRDVRHPGCLDGRSQPQHGLEGVVFWTVTQPESDPDGALGGFGQTGVTRSSLCEQKPPPCLTCLQGELGDGHGHPPLGCQQKPEVTLGL